VGSNPAGGMDACLL